ncbi:MAG: DNA topoisomerase III, partial [Duncaniella sp.]|nr:DNA topoisomerase III [Duncaniella sp.]
PDCRFMTTTVLGDVDGREFKATGKVITSPGWRDVYASSGADKEKEEGEGDDRILPPFTVGESGPQEPSLLKKTTQPPKNYTEGTLLRAMESAGKTVDDEELRDAMKENGIGRPSTRASIIETLFKRRYIARARKSIIATQAGIDLINTIKEELLKSAKLTGLWENKLRRIERGEYSAAQFIDELKVLMNEIVINVLSDNSFSKIDTGVTAARDNKSGGATATAADKPKPTKPRAPRMTKFEQVACPQCGEGHILKGRTAYGCSRYREGCTLRLNFTDYPDSLTPAKLKKMLTAK